MARLTVKKLKLPQTRYYTTLEVADFTGFHVGLYCKCAEDVQFRGECHDREIVK